MNIEDVLDELAMQENWRKLSNREALTALCRAQWEAAAEVAQACELGAEPYRNEQQRQIVAAQGIALIAASCAITTEADRLFPTTNPKGNK